LFQTPFEQFDATERDFVLKAIESHMEKIITNPHDLYLTLCVSYPRLTIEQLTFEQRSRLLEVMKSDIIKKMYSTDYLALFELPIKVLSIELRQEIWIAILPKLRDMHVSTGPLVCLFELPLYKFTTKQRLELFEAVERHLSPDEKNQLRALMKGKEAPVKVHRNSFFHKPPPVTNMILMTPSIYQGEVPNSFHR